MQSVGRYEIVRELGRGGMATVYLARQGSLGRMVALKELDALRAADPGLARRFLREARMAGSLSHPNIVTVHDYFEENGTPYIAMEYVDGGSLRPNVTAGLSLAQIGGVLEALLAGLGYAERQGIVHRDLKPENVLLTSDGRIKIADFGIAKASDRVMTTASLTLGGTTMGTPAYMSPEQALGDPVSARSDLYSLGVMTFEMLTGTQPFADTETPMGILLRQVNDPIPPVAAIRSDVDPGISAWVDQLVAKDPDERTPSAPVAWSELEELLQSRLGYDWRQAAALPVLAGTMPVARTAPRTPVTAAMAPRTPVTAAIPRAPTATLPPAIPMTEAAAASAPARRTLGGSRLIIAAFVLVAVIAALAGAAGHGGGSQPARGQPVSRPPRQASQPAASAPASTQPASTQPATAQPTAASPAAPQPAAGQPAAPLTGENADDGGDGGGTTTGGGTGENADDGGGGP
jgi:predicted Ser/Thr protein kinase